MSDTVFAPATPFGGALAIIRISGDDAKAVLDGCFSRNVAHGSILHGSIVRDGVLLDDCMAAFFKAPHSYTGEDMAELYIHGSYAVARSIFDYLCELGARPAQAGEFTKRAFINGKLDLSEAEAVMDVINSKTALGAREALLQLKGAVNDEIRGIEDELTDALAGLDAAMDYPDELEEDVFSSLPEKLSDCYKRLIELERRGLGRRLIRDGARVTIVGKPNAGKSSLLNALCGEDRAIVTSIAGTTRDALTEHIDIFGIPVLLTDTAGLRETGDEVERIGVSRAKEAVRNADLLLVAIDASVPWSDECDALIEECGATPKLIVLCKGDLDVKIYESAAKNATGIEAVTVSAITKEGMDELRTAIADMLLPDKSETHITNMRHIEAVAQAAQYLYGSWRLTDWDCLATDIERALEALSRITGRQVDAEVIDRIFERFCVGK